jgi:hypothetical protein
MNVAGCANRGLLLESSCRDFTVFLSVRRLEAGFWRLVSGRLAAFRNELTKVECHPLQCPLRLR